ncbi:MAG: hypothetical protein ACFCGT_13065 [Sandaracinaceae bacterium]
MPSAALLLAVACGGAPPPPPAPPPDPNARPEGAAADAWVGDVRLTVEDGAPPEDDEGLRRRQSAGWTSHTAADGKTVWVAHGDVALRAAVENVAPWAPALRIVPVLDGDRPSAPPRAFALLVEGWSDGVFIVGEEAERVPLENAPRSPPTAVQERTLAVAELAHCPGRGTRCLLVGPLPEVLATEDPTRPPGGFTMESITPARVADDVRLAGPDLLAIADGRSFRARTAAGSDGRVRYSEVEVRVRGGRWIEVARVSGPVRAPDYFGGITAAGTGQLAWLWGRLDATLHVRWVDPRHRDRPGLDVRAAPEDPDDPVRRLFNVRPVPVLLPGEDLITALYWGEDRGVLYEALGPGRRLPIRLEPAPTSPDLAEASHPSVLRLATCDGVECLRR